jgi:hypothetical protein
MGLTSYTGPCLRDQVIDKRCGKRLAWRTLVFVISEHGLLAHVCQALLILARLDFLPVALFLVQAYARQFSSPPRKDHLRARVSQKLILPLNSRSGTRRTYKHDTTPHLGDQATARTNLLSLFSALQDWLVIMVI